MFLTNFIPQGTQHDQMLFFLKKSVGIQVQITYEYTTATVLWGGGWLHSEVTTDREKGNGRGGMGGEGV